MDPMIVGIIVPLGGMFFVGYIVKTIVNAIAGKKAHNATIDAMQDRIDILENRLQRQERQIDQLTEGTQYIGKLLEERELIRK
jgi:predicted RNase H-like nuclease (RuvC/YqgF family)